MMSAPASAKASRKGSTGEIIRWTSNGLARVRPERLHHPGPMVRLGTKWPSMTSTWIQSAPGLVDRAHLLAELGEVGGQDRRGNEGCGHRARLTAKLPCGQGARRRSRRGRPRFRAGRAGCGPSRAGRGVTKSGSSPGRGAEISKSECRRGSGDGCLAFFRLERADRVDQRSTGLEPWRGAIEQLRAAARRCRG